MTESVRSGRTLEDAAPPRPTPRVRRVQAALFLAGLFAFAWLLASAGLEPAARLSLAAGIGLVILGIAIFLVLQRTLAGLPIELGLLFSLAQRFDQFVWTGVGIVAYSRRWAPREVSSVHRG